MLLAPVRFVSQCFMRSISGSAPSWNESMQMYAVSVVHESGGPPVRIVRTGEQFLIALALAFVVPDRHFHVDQVVVVRAVVMGVRHQERRHEKQNIM